MMILLVELLLNCRLQVAEVNLQRLNRLLRQLLLVLQLLVQPLIFLSLRKQLVSLCIANFIIKGCAKLVLAAGGGQTRE